MLNHQIYLLSKIYSSMGKIGMSQNSHLLVLDNIHRGMLCNHEFLICMFYIQVRIVHNQLDHLSGIHLGIQYNL